ncbi:Uncharacterized protein QTN25_005161 [Entamoeba marina]
MLSLLLLLLSFCLAYDGTCTSEELGITNSFTITTSQSDCPNTETGKIIITQNSATDALITYTLTEETTQTSVSSESNTFTVTNGTYTLKMVYDYTDRAFDSEEFNYTSFTCNVDTEIVITASYETISSVTQEVTNNTHCAGSYGKVVCKADVSNGTLSYLLSGTESRDAQDSGEFTNLAIGTYRCVVTSENCNSQGDEFSIYYESDCTDAAVWVDRQLYGEGQSLFYAGLALIIIGIVLNIAVFLLCLKLFLFDRKKGVKKPKKTDKQIS